eukprot:symbB.v1.2.041723.t1/scaffold8555.1/size5904/1
MVKVCMPEARSHERHLEWYELERQLGEGRNGQRQDE